MVSVRLRWWLLGLLVALGLAEGLIHFTRLNDFPLHNVDNRIGYIPKPNQSGAFLGMSNWHYNELSMGTPEPFKPSQATRDLLLVGDSVVNGGNPLDHTERVATKIVDRTGWNVWPISAGSWGLQNEVTWLNDHPEVVASVDQIAFVLNAGDFKEPSSFRSDFTHPREDPFPALPYVLQRYVVGYSVGEPPAHLKVPSRDELAMLAQFAARRPVHVFLYPHTSQLGQDCGWAPVALQTMPGVTTHCLDLSTGLRRDGFRDSVHTNPQGSEQLARLITDRLGYGSTATLAQ